MHMAAHMHTQKIIKGKISISVILLIRRIYITRRLMLLYKKWFP